MIIRAMAWTMLDETLVIEATVGLPSGVGTDEAPSVWRRFTASIDGALDRSSAADMLWLVGQELSQMARQDEPS